MRVVSQENGERLYGSKYRLWLDVRASESWVSQVAFPGSK